MLHDVGPAPPNFGVSAIYSLHPSIFRKWMKGKEKMGRGRRRGKRTVFFLV